jgi:hypothetical protein
MANIRALLQRVLGHLAWFMPQGGSQDLRTWCVAMENGSGCRITLSNVAYDIEEMRSPRAVVKTIIDRAVARWAQRHESTPRPDDAERSAEVLTHTLDAAEEDLFCRGPDARLQEPASRIVDRLTLQENYLLNTSRGTKIRPHAPGSLHPVLVLEPAQIRPGAMVRGKRPFAWITRTSSITWMERGISKDPNALATRVRDFLGLDHFTDHELLEMRYPPGILDGERTAAPTFIEGACKEAYRSKRGADGWGRAVDIGSADLADGGPEAVHSPIPFTAAFMLRQIGFVRSSRLSSHVKLQDACPRHWQSMDVRGLENYVK